MKSQNDENIYKIGVIDKEGNIESEIIVKNFNQLANSYKISEEEVLAKLDILNYLKDITAKFNDFNEFIVARENSIKSKKVSQNLVDTKVVVAKSKPQKISIPKEQKQELKRAFNEMLSNFKGDLSDFDSCVAKIREQLSIFLKSSADS